MKVAVLFSGGKDSTLAALLAKKEGYEISCLLSIISENKHSFMFHTPSISKVRVQAEAMEIPLIVQETKGEKEKELDDLKDIIKEARDKYSIEGVVTGAVESVYQASRVQKICLDLGVECFNPLWQKNQYELLVDLVNEGIRAMIVGVFAYPLGKEFLGKEIDLKFIEEIKVFQKKYKINPAGEGGEFESFVLGCPLFKKPLEVINFQDFGEGYSWRREVEVL